MGADECCARGRRHAPRRRRARLEGAILIITAVALPPAALAPLRARETVAFVPAPGRPASSAITGSPRVWNTAALWTNSANVPSAAGHIGWQAPKTHLRASSTATTEEVVVTESEATSADGTVADDADARKEQERLLQEQRQEELSKELNYWGGLNWVVSALAAVGVLDTGYLTAVKLGQAPLACPTDAEFSCGQVLSSPYASIGPVPLAALGFVAYAAVFALSLSKEWPRSAILWWLCFAMALASSALMLLLLIVLHAPCAFCAASAITSALLLGVVETGKARTEETGRGSPRVAIVVLAAAIAGAGVRAATLPPKGAPGTDGEDFADLIERYKPEHPPVRSESGPAEIALAKHLTAIGAQCYTAWWCPHCQDQREQFGKQAVEFGPFVQCSELNRRQNAFCKEKDIPSYPTWIIDGEMYKGGKPLAKLAEISGFTEYPAEAFSERPDSATDYIWN